MSSAPVWPFAASRDCSRWRSMALAKPASSTVAPCPATISRVNSIGNPWVSCNLNAVSPLISVPPASSASSKAMPERRLERKRSSSRVGHP